MPAYTNHTWNDDQRCRLQLVDKSYVRDQNGMDSESNESIYERFGRCFKKWRNEVVKHSALKWFDHLESTGRNQMTRRWVGVDTIGVRGKPPIVC